ncbi:fatty acid desaturase [Antrihabitans cavernicola]|uniref:2Fe-2S iron-sulfur cluster binding domain-containing protein n=1 Tax=Antrihabitans cavernicola TaxID=2495913 RepID=A0A5A7S4P6_9NOCA|nr:fatty acid desaturase [Spelaeibacter cavernicola]KAA0016771.1 2Fe-2S iron-sulfur cluster binding domain-containing protein [Spelaeibacter cavernicola]
MTLAGPTVADRSLATDVAELYERTRARMGDEDLEHIRTVAAYSQAIKKCSRELLQQGGSADAMRRGVVLYALHSLLEFSELGHNILHGSYDHLSNCGEFHSDRWVWDFNIDPHEWKVMHHQNHHPFTNITDKDHDLGYSIVRLQPGQDWYAHHVVQLALIAPALLSSMSYYMGVYTAMSAARTEGRKVLRPSTFPATSNIIAQHASRDYVREPFAAGPRLLHTALGNALGATLGHMAVFFLVALEHHAPNVELFHDPGPGETPDQYYERQIRGTTNFERSERFDNWLQFILADVDFPNPPDFRIFYGGLDTHLEHHLFPDLPPNRQREIQDDVRDLCARHGLPYNTYPINTYIPLAFRKLGILALPMGEREVRNPLRLLRAPIDAVRRLAYGVRFQRNPYEPYLEAPKFFDAKAKVIRTRREARGQAHTFRIAKPAGWDDITWDAGAFLSVRVPVRDETLVRQYSLVRDSVDSDVFEICVKRVEDGRVSNHLNDALRSGKRIMLVGPPTSDGPFVMKDLPERPLFIAGGVGITPIISMIRKIAREAPDTDAVLLYFNRDEHSIVFDDEIRQLTEQTNLRVEHFCDVAPRSRDHLRQGRISVNLLREFVPDLADRDVYVCAPGVVVDLARDFCTELGLPADRFHTESFSPPALVRPAEGADDRYRVRFRRSDTDIEIDGCTTLLEAARSAGVTVPSGCERGLCRACVSPKLRGITQLESDGAQLARITVCNSLPRSDIELDL